jgi:polyferredoxin
MDVCCGETMKRKDVPFIIRVSSLPFLGPVLIIGWSILGGLNPHIAGGLLGCPFPLPFVMCHVCPTTCAFGLIRSWLLGGIIITDVLFGRVFCGLICPFGTIQDLHYKLSSTRVKIGAADKALRYVKFGALVLVAGLVIDLLYMELRIPIADDLLLFIIMNREKAIVIGSIIIVSILAISLFISRPWCRYLCPFGALISLSNMISVLLIKRNPQNCIKCGACEQRCIANLNLMNGGEQLASIECVRCFECYFTCERNALNLHARLKRYG